MLITRKHLPRRTFLRGMGATVALPLLDAMTPAFAQGPAPTPRIGFIYFPHGAIMAHWTPDTTGRGFAIKDTLEPLAPYPRPPQHRQWAPPSRRGFDGRSLVEPYDVAQRRTPQADAGRRRVRGRYG